MRSSETTASKQDFEVKWNIQRERKKKNSKKENKKIFININIIMIILLELSRSLSIQKKSIAHHDDCASRNVEAVESNVVVKSACVEAKHRVQAQRFLLQMRKRARKIIKTK